MNNSETWQSTNIPPSAIASIFGFNGDGYDKTFIGVGEEYYGKVRLQSIKNSPTEDHISTPIMHFLPKEENEELAINLEAKNIYEHSDPEGKVYKYSNIFSERIRTILKNVEDVSDFLKQNKRNSSFNVAFQEISELASAEWKNNNAPQNEYFLTRKKELRKYIHKILCVAENTEYANEWNEKIRPKKDELINLSLNLMKSEEDISPQYENFKKAESTLIKKAVSHYNETHDEPFLIE